MNFSPNIEGPDPLSSELAASIDAQLNAALAAPAPAQPAKAEEPAKAASAPRIRGPRVVQAGREHRTGTVVSVGPSDIFLEFGPKELGVVPRVQFDDASVPAVGQSLEVVVDRFEAAESLFLCSRPGMIKKAQWEMLEPGQKVEAMVTGVAQAKGKSGAAGLELEIAGHKAFMPAGQVSFDHIADLSVFVGQKLACVVSRVDRMGRGNIVLSRREILQQERTEKAAALKASLQEGQSVEGTVRKIMPFGAFVDIGGVDGLVHVSDLTFDRVGFGEKAVARHVQEGQKVTVKILKLDWENNRIGLGLKQVMGDPFAAAAQEVTEGATITGRVARIAEFGAFVEIRPGVEGLVHISELDHKRIAKVEDALKVDEVVQAKVLKIDPASRRISLSVKALKALPEVKIGEGSGPGGGPGRGRDKKPMGRSAEEILKETPALRRLREKNRQTQFKGGIA